MFSFVCFATFDGIRRHLPVFVQTYPDNGYLQRALPPPHKKLASTIGRGAIVESSFAGWIFLLICILNRSLTGFLGYFITFWWILGMINAYNLMDGRNGMVGDNAIIVSISDKTHDSLFIVLLFFV